MTGAAFMSVLSKELAEERAQGLGRAERIMTAALEKYRLAKDRAPADARTRGEVDELLWDLTRAVASFVIQREACGLADTSRVLKLYAIPIEVVTRLGARRDAKATAC
jgi:hypothetical protein